MLMADENRMISDIEGREMKAENGREIAGEKPVKEREKGRGFYRLWPVAFFLALLALLFFLLRAFPVSANSYAALRERPGFMPAVRMELKSPNAYHIGIAEVDPATGQAVAAMLLYEMGDGEALVMVDVDTLEEMMSSPEPIALRGVIAPLADEVKADLPEVFQNFYGLSAAEAEARAGAALYVDGRWERVSGQFLPMFIAAVVAALCFVMSLFTGRKAKEAETRNEKR